MERKNFIENTNFFSVSDFRYGIDLKPIRTTYEENSFQIKGFDLCFSNALRRTLLNEISTMSIDKVYFYDNSSILNDEVIAHRLGLIPIFISPKIIDYLKEKKLTKKLKILFSFSINHPNTFSRNVSIYSNSIKLKNYSILGNLFKNFSVKPAFKDILIAKLNPGQKIDCECECLIATGNTHAKFSPVGTTFYKILPKIKIIGEIFGKEALSLFQKCPVRVFDIEEVANCSMKRLTISYPNVCTLCKECLDTSDGFDTKIRIGRHSEKITFITESTGVFSPEILFHRAIYLLVGKCNTSLLSLLHNFEKFM